MAWCTKGQRRVGGWRRGGAGRDPTSSDPQVMAAFAPVFRQLRTYLLPVLERLLCEVLGVREGDLRLGLYQGLTRCTHSPRHPVHASHCGVCTVWATGGQGDRGRWEPQWLHEPEGARGRLWPAVG